MIDLETRYRRFEDFGLVFGFVVVATMIGCALRYASGDIQTYRIPLRVAFYLSLACNLIGLRTCVRHESPVASQQQRTRKELTMSVVVILIATAIGGLCFELI